VCGLHSNLIFSILPLAPPIDSELLAGLPQQQSKGPAAGCSCPPRQSVLVHVDSPASTCPGSRPRAASSSRLAPQTSCRLRGMAALRWALWRAAVHGLPLSQSQPEIEPPTTTGLRELLNLPSGWRTIRWCFSEFLPCDFVVWSWLLLLESVGFSPGSCAVDSHFFSSRRATRDGRSGEQSEAARRGADARREKARAGKNRRGMARAGNPGLFFLRYGWATSPGGWSVGPTGTGGWVHMWWVTKELHF
jgi:hypothetical protein